MATTLETTPLAMDLVLWIRTFFLASSAVGVVLGSFPFLRGRYMDYGIRSRPQSQRASPPQKGPLPIFRGSFLDSILTLEVPHSFFIHYYVVSVLSTCFWGHQLWSHGWAIQAMSNLQTSSRSLDRMSVSQVWVCWSLMLAQGARRLCESLIYMKHSQATMPISIYLIGILFYLATSVAVWIEGVDSVLQHDLGDSQPPVSSIWFSLPVIVFMVASLLQFVCHRHLASLRKYSVPTNFLFRRVVCPHYLMECVIYLMLSRIAAPTGQLLNITLLSVTAFVAINLGVVADSTREWWRSKFGDTVVRGRSRMLPIVW